MDLVELFRARQIWHELIQMNEAHKLDWMGWIDEALRATAATPPYWLCEAAFSKDFEDFARLIRTDIGIDESTSPETVLDEEGLAFGLNYHLLEGEPCSVIWRELREVGDVDGFVEYGRWRKYQPHQAIDLSKSSLDDLVVIVFQPVRQWALASVEKILGKSAAERLIPLASRLA